MRIVRPRNGNVRFRGETHVYEVIQNTYTLDKEEDTNILFGKEEDTTINNYIKGKELETNTSIIEESDLESVITSIHDELKQEGKILSLRRNDSEQNTTDVIYEKKGLVFLTTNSFYSGGRPVTINESLVKKGYE